MAWQPNTMGSSRSRDKLRVVIVSGLSACNNPRVVKEADALSAAGHEVEVLGAWVQQRFKDRDLQLLAGRAWRFTPVVDLCQASTSTKLRRQWLRVRWRLNCLLYQRCGWFNAGMLGYAAHELRRAVQSRQADIFIAHTEAAMAAVEPLLNSKRQAAQNVRVGLDVEDWFSEMFTLANLAQAPVAPLRRLERKLLNSAAFTFCTSDAMAEALVEQYGCPRPTTIYNVFPWSDREQLDGLYLDRRDDDRTVPSIHWFSQTIGPGRGLEELFDALPLLKQRVVVHLRGTLRPLDAEWLEQRVPAEHRASIRCHDQVPNHELLSRIAEHDIGLAGEQLYCRNRQVTITNKVFQYWLGGLAVVASDTSGQTEALRQAPEAGLLYQAENAASLAESLNQMLTSRERLAAAKSAALRAAHDRFCWEQEAPRLVATIESSTTTACHADIS